MMRQFWGKEMLLFTECVPCTSPLLSDPLTDDGFALAGNSNEGKGIEGFIASEPDEARRARVADVARGTLQTIFDNPEKGAIQHSIIHRLIRDYMTISASLSDNVKRREQLFEGFVRLSSRNAFRDHTDRWYALIALFFLQNQRDPARDCPHQGRIVRRSRDPGEQLGKGPKADCQGLPAAHYEDV